MSQAVKAVPDGYHTITPHLRMKGAAAAIDFYQRVFGAEEFMRMSMPDGRVGHAELRVGDSVLMLSDEFPEQGALGPPAQGSGVTIMLYIEDVDAVFGRAVSAGAKAVMPPADMFWGDRYGRIVDPFGHEWALATHIEDLTPEEMRRRGEAAMAEMCKPG